MAISALPIGLERRDTVFVVIALAAVRKAFARWVRMPVGPIEGVHTVLAAVAAAGSCSTPSLLSV